MCKKIPSLENTRQLANRYANYTGEAIAIYYNHSGYQFCNYQFALTNNIEILEKIIPT